MGESQGPSEQGRSGRHNAGWRKGDPDAQDALRNFLAGGEATQFKRTHAAPSVGDRFGELTVVGPAPSRGKGPRTLVQCSCGADPHEVDSSSLRRGKSTRCNQCAKRKGAASKSKNYWRYEDVCPDIAHRRRLLNRIAACVNRCHNPNDKGYPNYGGRGIQVYEPWRTSRQDFLAHLVTLDGWDRPELELDRREVNKGYEPGNVRFVTKSVNSYNKRTVRDLEARIAELERRLRHCTCGASEQVHDQDR